MMSPYPRVVPGNSRNINRQWCAPATVWSAAALFGDMMRANAAAVAGVTRSASPGSVASGRSLRTVIMVSPVFTGSVKLPVKVAPGARRISSPGCAASSAACRLPPAGTVTTAARAIGGPASEQTRRTEAQLCRPAELKKVSINRRGAGST